MDMGLFHVAFGKLGVPAQSLIWGSWEGLERQLGHGYIPLGKAREPGARSICPSHLCEPWMDVYPTLCLQRLPSSQCQSDLPWVSREGAVKSHPLVNPFRKKLLTTACYPVDLRDKRAFSHSRVAE